MARILQDPRMNLDSRNAQRVIDEIGQATTPEEALSRSSRAWDLLLAQFHLLCDRANGYPRNPIDGETWWEGHQLARVCDRFADSVQKQGNRSGELQAAALATAIACQVVAHYPEEIFPRVLRTARCREAVAKPDEAADDYLAILEDFRNLELESLLDGEEAPQDSQRCVLTCLVAAIEALERLDPARLGGDAGELKARATRRCLANGAPVTTSGS
jgi:hypothetical protein